MAESPPPEATPPGEAWVVCHTKPRCEKKFAALVRAERLEHYLPLVESVRRYAQQTKRFTKPLFPGYVFARVPLEHKARIYQQELLARAIPVADESTFLRQIVLVRTMVASGYQLTVLPLLTRGRRVRVVGGPLHGLEGFVDDPANPQGIVLSVDVLRQGLLVTLPVEKPGRATLVAERHRLAAAGGRSRRRWRGSSSRHQVMGLEMKPEEVGRMHGRTGRQGGDRVVDHNAPAPRKVLQPRDAKGFGDVEEAEQPQSHEAEAPNRQGTQQRRPAQKAQGHGDEFVEDHLARILVPEAKLRLPADSHGQIGPQRAQQQVLGEIPRAVDAGAKGFEDHRKIEKARHRSPGARRREPAAHRPQGRQRQHRAGRQEAGPDRLGPSHASAPLKTNALNRAT